MRERGGFSVSFFNRSLSWDFYSELCEDEKNLKYAMVKMKLKSDQIKLSNYTSPNN